MAFGHNLDKPIPIRENGGIVAFETPKGRINSSDPRFAKWIKSYEQE